ncbi:MAG: hypothetical protein K6G81_03330 [Lachnospiraceae bacterium]|nr:hypothetical protein [Lachnospiraceae bacterium]
MDRILAILADGTGYAQELAAYLNTRKNFIFKTVLFRNPTQLKKYYSENQVDMLLCSEEAVHNNEFRIKNICVLSDACGAGEALESDENGCHMIFKYQSGEAVMKEIMDYYSSKQRRDEEADIPVVANRRIICVCSPVGGSFASTFALALAQYLSIGGRTLYISFDPFFAYPGEEKSHTDKNLSDLMYYMEVAKGGIMDFITRLAHHCGSLDYISGVSHWFDIVDMSKKNMHKLIDVLNSNDIYTNIVFDMGTAGSASMELLAGCEDVYLVTKKGINASKAVEEWKRQMLFTNHRDIVEKSKEVEIPHDELLEGEYSFEVLLKGHLGRFIEETEGLKYCR